MLVCVQVDMIRSRASVANINQEMWTPAHEEMIQKFITDASVPLIIAFHDPYKGFVVDTVVPPHLVDQLTYFIKQEGTAEVTFENILKCVQYGTVKGTHIESLLRVMMGIYAPIFFENTTWPDSILSVLWDDITALINKHYLHIISFSIWLKQLCQLHCISF